MNLEMILLWIGVLLFLGILSIKLSDRSAIPVLLFFLFIGMLAGSEGIGGIHFDNAQLAKSIGIVSLIFIIFSGGLNTNWKESKKYLAQGMVLSTLGVLITAIVTGLFAVWIFKFTILEGMLIGSIISSTDAAAVFAVLKSKKISLKAPLKPLLELESGSNDPMAVFLTVALISIMKTNNPNVILFILSFILDMAVGAIVGIAMIKAITFMVRKMKLDYDGLYPIITISMVMLAYVASVFLRGNGILAVYITGVGLSRAEFTNKKTIIRFHDGLAWMSQIAMFITLGLLVFPSHIVPLIGRGLLLTLILMIVARPLSVYLCLLPFRIGFRKKIMIAWVGLRGAVPIILATFPFTAGLPMADAYFNIVFFVVLASVFIQGTSIPFVSKLLNVTAPFDKRRKHPIEFEKNDLLNAELHEIIVPENSSIEGKMLKQIGVPEDCLILLIARKEKYVIPTGSTIISSNDVLLILAENEGIRNFNRLLMIPKQ